MCPHSTRFVIDTAFTRIHHPVDSQEIAKKARLAAQKQRLAQEVNMVQSALQQKLTEQKAGLVSAQKKGVSASTRTPRPPVPSSSSSSAVGRRHGLCSCDATSTPGHQTMPNPLRCSPNPSPP